VRAGHKAERQKFSGGFTVHLSALRRRRAAQPEFNGGAQPDVQGGGVESLQEGLENCQRLNGFCGVCKAGKWKMAQSGDYGEVLNEKCLLRMRSLRKLLSN